MRPNTRPQHAQRLLFHAALAGCLLTAAGCLDDDYAPPDCSDCAEADIRISEETIERACERGASGRYDEGLLESGIALDLDSACDSVGTCTTLCYVCPCGTDPDDPSRCAPFPSAPGGRTCAGPDIATFDVQACAYDLTPCPEGSRCIQTGPDQAECRALGAECPASPCGDVGQTSGAFCVGLAPVQCSVAEDGCIQTSFAPDCQRGQTCMDGQCLPVDCLLNPDDPACQTDACDNGRLDDGEDCDGADLGGQTCASQGFDRGTLRCTAQCAFDTSLCANDPAPAVCGDGQCEAPSEDTGTCCADCGCPGAQICLQGACQDPPAVCGDGLRNGAEDCDGADLGGEDCASRGFERGSLSCTAQCGFDLSACCDRTTCAAEGATCGEIPDGCGGTLNCGPCSPTITSVMCTTRERGEDSTCTFRGTGFTVGDSGGPSDPNRTPNAFVSNLRISNWSVVSATELRVNGLWICNAQLGPQNAAYRSSSDQRADLPGAVTTIMGPLQVFDWGPREANAGQQNVQFYFNGCNFGSTPAVGIGNVNISNVRLQAEDQVLASGNVQNSPGARQVCVAKYSGAPVGPDKWCQTGGFTILP